MCSLILIVGGFQAASLSQAASKKQRIKKKKTVQKYPNCESKSVPSHVCVSVCAHARETWLWSQKNQKTWNKKHQIIFTSWHMSIFVWHSEIWIERLIFLIFHPIVFFAFLFLNFFIVVVRPHTLNHWLHYLYNVSTFVAHEKRSMHCNKNVGGWINTLSFDLFTVLCECTGDFLRIGQYFSALHNWLWPAI